MNIITISCKIFLFGATVWTALLAQEKDEDSKQLTIENSIGMKFCHVPAGEFEMGSPESEAGRWNIEHLHNVEISQPYFMGAHEVTQSQFEQVMGFNPSSFSNSGGKSHLVEGTKTDDFPVEWVSHDDAMEFCAKLSCLPIEIAENRFYRLPTEAEWERACRAGGSAQIFSFGNTLSYKQANIKGDEPYGETDKGEFIRRTTRVGTYPPNAFGLFDMHGNVAEWCLDRYDREYYWGSPSVDPMGRLDSRDSCYVIRGGDWNKSGVAARSAQRAPRPPTNKPFTTWRSNDVGFRVVCVARNINNLTADGVAKEFSNGFRYWVSATGSKSKQMARVSKLSRKEVELEYKNQSKKIVALNKLSDGDKKYLKSFKKGLVNQIGNRLVPYRLVLRNDKIEFKSAIELNRSLSDLSKSKREIKSAEKARQKINKQARELDRERFRLRQLYVTAQRAADQVPSSNVNERNRAVGALNSLQAQIEALEINAASINKDRSDLTTLRSKYIRVAQRVKSQSVSLKRELENVKRSQIVKQVSEELSTIIEDVKFVEPAILERSEKIVGELETSILSGSVPLKVNGGTKIVNVEINGKNIDMVLDTGASLITIPNSIAKEIGLVSKPSDTDVELKIADGSRITAKLVKLNSVRVGKFEVKDVACAILGPEANSATPLLGLSFLDHFVFNLYGENLRLEKIGSQ